MNKLICKASDPALTDFIQDAKYMDKLVCIEIHKPTRSTAQSRARWVYLTQISEILNERGETYQPIGMTIDVPFTKENLYHIYWQSLRGFMFPGKTKQLNTTEFSKLVDHAQMLFAKIFDIHINFPNWQDLAT
jgi:hypothetical protein